MLHQQKQRTEDTGIPDAPGNAHRLREELAMDMGRNFPRGRKDENEHNPSNASHFPCETCGVTPSQKLSQAFTVPQTEDWDLELELQQYEWSPSAHSSIHKPKDEIANIYNPSNKKVLGD
ncbi:hypothetical protein CHS0354_016283 [Potamilus streckersoni]|uniref:Uncharacterized protein n=1 Tax=Potamilus streckersoni TaxID=2493646 RepID=A0AAE0RXC8_9BIVA|nr:hypothetical protein CHS0354_016283 [Potamilus streckersoni]